MVMIVYLICLMEEVDVYLILLVAVAVIGYEC